MADKTSWEKRGFIANLVLGIVSIVFSPISFLVISKAASVSSLISAAAFFVWIGLESFRVREIERINTAKPPLDEYDIDMLNVWGKNSAVGKEVSTKIDKWRLHNSETIEHINTERLSQEQAAFAIGVIFIGVTAFFLATS